MNNEPVAVVDHRQQNGVTWLKVIKGRSVMPEHNTLLYTHPSEHDLGIAEAIGFEKGHKSAEDMLRQQQAEIEALKAGKIRAYDNGVEDGRKPDTNNKPVAWMETYKGEPNNLDWDKSNLNYGSEFHDVVPLYTHPVKEQDTECQYCKQGCIRCDARKQLTDAEIYKIANGIEAIQHQHGLRLSNDLNVMDFARAILRKASEK